MIMKKEQMELKEVIKAAILEAFAEMYGVATLASTNNEAPKEDESGKGGDSETSSGGGTNNGRPRPDVGVGAYSMR